MRFVKMGFLFPFFISCGVGSSYALECDNLSKEFAFHAERVRELGHGVEDPDTADIEIFVELIGLPNLSKINELKLNILRTKNPGFDNAVAFEGKGCRTIVFDPYWASGDTPGFYLILAHEAGHQFCEHTIGMTRLNHNERELEADEFSGASISRYEIYHGRKFFDQVYAAAKIKYSEQDSSRNPPLALRLKAIKRGYVHGSHCGNLAPVVEEGHDAPHHYGKPKLCRRMVRTGPTSYSCAE